MCVVGRVRCVSDEAYFVFGWMGGVVGYGAGCGEGGGGAVGVRGVEGQLRGVPLDIELIRTQFKQKQFMVVH